MNESFSNPVDSLNAAIAIGKDGLVSNPLDLIGLISPVAEVESNAREVLWRRLFLEAPLPYWHIVNWAQKLKEGELKPLVEKTQSSGWNSIQSVVSPLSVDAVLQEVVDRFDKFDPDLFPWESPSPNSESPQRIKYLLGRALACSYVEDQLTTSKILSDRAAILLRAEASWKEWIDVNELAGYLPASVCEATAIALDHIVSRNVTPGIDGVGRTHILLEQLNVDLNSTAAVVTAYLLPLGEQHKPLDGIIVPDLRENGLIEISPQFLEGVSRAGLAEQLLDSVRRRAS